MHPKIASSSKQSRKSSVLMLAGRFSARDEQHYQNTLAMIREDYSNIADKSY